MADKEVKISFKTNSDTSGAEAASKAIRDVADATADAAAAASASGDSDVWDSVRIIDYAAETRRAAESASDAAESVSKLSQAGRRQETVFQALEAKAKAAGDQVERARAAAERSGDLTPLRDLELQLQRLTEEAKVFDQALAQVESAGGGQGGVAEILQARIDLRETEIETVLEKLGPLEEAAKAEAENAAAMRDAAEAARQLREAQRQARLETELATTRKVQMRRALGTLVTGLQASAGRIGILGVALRSLTSPVALVSTGIAGLISLIARWRANGQRAAEEEKKSIEETAKATEALLAKRREAAAEAGRQRAAGLLDSIRDETAAINAQTAALERNIRLRSAQLAAEGRIQEAAFARRGAEIEIDPTLDDAGRSAARARLQRERDRAQAEAELAAIRQGLEVERLRVDEATREAQTADNRRADAQGQLELFKQRERELRRQQLEAQQAAASADGVLGLIAGIEAENARIITGSRGVLGSDQERQLDANRAEIERLRAEEAALRSAGFFEGGDELASIRGSISTLEADIAAAADESERLAKAATEAFDAFRGIVEIERARAGGIIGGFLEGTGQRSAEEERERRERQRREEEQRQREAEAARLERDREIQAVSRGASDLGGSGIAVSASAREQIDRAAAALRDGEDPGEVNALLGSLIGVVEALADRNDAQAVLVRQYVARVRALERGAANSR